MRKRGALVAAVLGGGVLAVGAALWVFREEAAELVHEIRTGYRFEWMPERVVPGRFAVTSVLNASGTVTVERAGEDGRQHGGVWTASGKSFRPLPAPGGAGRRLLPTAINDRGDVVCQEEEDAPARGKTTARKVGARAWLWTAEGELAEIPSLGDNIIPFDMNERRQVVGVCIQIQALRTRAFFWEPGSPTRELESNPLGPDSQPMAINEQGWVAGERNPGGDDARPFLFRPEGGMSEPGLPSGFSTGRARCINDKGEILVNAVTTNATLPFLWREAGGYTALPVPEGYVDVEGMALNNHGLVLLSAARDSSRRETTQFLVSSGTVARLPQGPKGIATQYYKVNDRGWLVGWGSKKVEEGPAGQRLGFLAMPR